MTQEDDGFGRDPRMDQVRVHVLKLKEGEENLFETRAIQELGSDEKFFEDRGALEPPYDPRLLMVIHEHSNALRQNVDAYSTNIDGFGHSFKAVIDLEADTTIDEVRTLIALEQNLQGTLDEVKTASPDQVTRRIEELANDQRVESLKLNSFFDNCAEESFIELRTRTRDDVEITGNGYWEVVRDQRGRVAQFNHVESHTVRLCRLDEMFTNYTRKQRTLTQDFEEVTRRKRFRRYVQKVGSRAVFFKEFGDPRCVSAETGVAFVDEAAMRKVEENAPTATEIVHHKIPSSRSAYGIPRWIGNLLSVMGSRQSEDVNFQYFENKSVPPLAVLVSGGRLTKDSVDKLESFIKNEIRGKQNFHKILIIEAEGAESTPFENSGRMKVELKPLTEAQNSDALFQMYDERNIDKVGMSFRVPRMLRGDTRDFNRSCYSEDTETLTELGWKRYDEIPEGIRIAAFDPDTGSIRFEAPAEKHVHPGIEEKLLHFQNAAVDMLVTSDHRMLVRETPDGPWTVFRAAEIPYEAYYVARAVVTTGREWVLDPLMCRIDARADVKEVDYAGTVYCFSVPNYGFFVTRRNGKIAIQGNTAMAALDFAERQVFEPLRTKFDDWMNRNILPSLGIRHWKLKSNGPTQRDPESLAKMIHDLQDFMPPNVLMELCQGVFNRNFPRVDPSWGDKPLKLTLAEASQKASASTPEAEDADPDNQAPNNEPESSTLEESDNKTPAPGEPGAGQGREGNGQFGGQAGGGKKPKKQRPQPARKAEDDEVLDDAAQALLDVRGRLRRAVLKANEERIREARTRSAAVGEEE